MSIAPTYSVSVKDLLSIEPSADASAVLHKNIPFDLVYEDDSFENCTVVPIELVDSPRSTQQYPFGNCSPMNAVSLLQELEEEYLNLPDQLPYELLKKTQK